MKHKFSLLNIFVMFCMPCFFICQFLVLNFYSSSKALSIPHQETFEILTNKNTVRTNKYTTFSYAQVEKDNTYLFKTNLSTFSSNAYFEIPKTYFVMILSNIDDTFYKVQYKDLSGFVLKSSVQFIAETPNTPYLDGVTFRVYASDGLNLMSSPFLNSQEVVTRLPNLPTLSYYGKIEGDELVENRGTTWFYCQYETSTQEIFKGYVYAGFCDNLSAFSENTEVVTKAENPFSSGDHEYLYNLITLSPFLKALIILLLSVPSVPIIFMLTHPAKASKTKQTLKSDKKTKTSQLNKIQSTNEDNTI